MLYLAPETLCAWLQRGFSLIRINAQNSNGQAARRKPPNSPCHALRSIKSPRTSNLSRHLVFSSPRLSIPVVPETSPKLSDITMGWNPFKQTVKVFKDVQANPRYYWYVADHVFFSPMTRLSDRRCY
jgi:hypothetical protein